MANSLETNQQGVDMQVLFGLQIGLPKMIEAEAKTKDAIAYARWIMETLRVPQVLRNVLEVWEKGEITNLEEAGRMDSDGFGSVEVLQAVTFSFSHVVKGDSQKEHIVTDTRLFGVSVLLEAEEDQKRGRVSILDTNPLRAEETERLKEVEIPFVTLPLESIAQRVMEAAMRTCNPEELPERLIAQTSQRLEEFQKKP